MMMNNASRKRKPPLPSRQTTLLNYSTNLSKSNNDNTTSRKRLAAAIEVLDDDTLVNVEQVAQESLGPIPYKRFLEMWKAVEEDDGWDTCDFEATHAFKKANNKPEKSDVDDGKQIKAQYGRFSFKATRVLFEKIVPLKWFHVFCDLGHGVGNTVLQAAYTVGCESRGIELVGFRHERADVYRQKLEELDLLHNQLRDDKVCEHYVVCHMGGTCCRVRVSHHFPT